MMMMMDSFFNLITRERQYSNIILYKYCVRKQLIALKQFQAIILLYIY